MEWRRKSYGVHSANGRKLVVVLETENDRNRHHPLQAERR